jgi:glycosyltransferase involved in cell wall biosynthesis
MMFGEEKGGGSAMAASQVAWASSTLQDDGQSYVTTSGRSDMNPLMQLAQAFMQGVPPISMLSQAQAQAQEVSPSLTASYSASTDSVAPCTVVAPLPLGEGQVAMAKDAIVSTDNRPPPGHRARSRFCLVMIVRDEAPVIQRCLDSVRNIITSFVICDTGSTDCTPTIIEHYAKQAGIPGCVLRHPWRNFGYNRTWVFDRAREIEPDAQYWCWLDADEVYLTRADDPLSYPTAEDADKLYRDLQCIQLVSIFQILTHYSSLRYNRWNIARNNQRYRWDLPVHELFIGETNNLVTPISNICLLARKQGNSSRRDRSQEDVRNLEEYVAAHPHCTRGHFYLAQCKMDAGDMEGAKAAYLHRASMQGGYKQEAYVSWLRLGRIERDPTLKKVYLMNAIEACPQRLEAYHALMRWDGDWHYQYGAMAPLDRLMHTHDWLFVEPALYEYMFDFDLGVACWVKKRYQEAYQAGERSMRGLEQMPESIRTQALENMRFYKMHYTPPGAVGTDASPSSSVTTLSTTKATATTATAAAAPAPLAPRGGSGKGASAAQAASVGVHPVCRLQPRLMKTTVLIVDDFLPDPHAVRTFALAQDFNVKGNFPGGRTRSFAKEAIGLQFKTAFEKLLNKSVTYWPESYNCSYQVTWGDHKSWIHRDQTDVGAVLYLTPDAPLSTGTTFFQHKATGLEAVTKGTGEEKLMDQDSNNPDAWHQVDSVANRFNRLILFNGRRSHRSTEYFGKDKESGRLFAAFFFDVEP